MMKLLINQDEIARISSISGNMDINNLTPYIKMAQDANLKSILGAQLYSKIENDFLNDSLSGDYKKIYDEYVVDMLVYFTMYYTISFHNYKIGNNGILIASPDDYETMSAADITQLATKYKQLAASFELRFKNEITTKFNVPEYQKNNSSNGNFQFPWML